MATSKVITENDLSNILNEVLPPTPSEYKTLLWTNGNLTTNFVETTISNLNLSEYDEVEIICTNSTSLTTTVMGSTRIPIGFSAILTEIGGTAGYNSGGLAGVTRYCTVNTNSIVIGQANLAYDGAAYATGFNHNLIPYKIYGIKYGQVAPPIVDDNGVWTKVNADYVRVSKRNGIVTVCGESSGGAGLLASAWTNLGTLPVGYRPLYTVNFVVNDRSNLKPCWGQVETSGNVRVFGDSGAASNYWEYGVTFPVAD